MTHNGMHHGQFLPVSPLEFRRMMILVMEDGSQLAEVITPPLTREQFAVETTDNKGEALCKATDHGDDLILLDNILL